MIDEITRAVDMIMGPGPYTRQQAPLSELEVMQASLREAEARLNSNSVMVPDWIVRAGVPVKYSKYNVKWHIQLPVQVQITEVIYLSYLHTPTRTASCRVLLWLPIDKDGSYRTNGLYADSNPLPHVTNNGACLALGDAPTVINSWENYKSFQRSLTRGLRQINLSSLYNLHKTAWPKEVRNAIPGPVRRHIGRNQMGAIPTSVLDKYFKYIGSANDEETTWTTQMLSTPDNNR